MGEKGEKIAWVVVMRKGTAVKEIDGDITLDRAPCCKIIHLI